MHFTLHGSCLQGDPRPLTTSAPIMLTNLGDDLRVNRALLSLFNRVIIKQIDLFFRQTSNTRNSSSIPTFDSGIFHRFVAFLPLHRHHPPQR